MEWFHLDSHSHQDSRCHLFLICDRIHAISLSRALIIVSIIFTIWSLWLQQLFVVIVACLVTASIRSWRKRTMLLFCSSFLWSYLPGHQDCHLPNAILLQGAVLCRTAFDISNWPFSVKSLNTLLVNGFTRLASQFKHYSMAYAAYVSSQKTLDPNKDWSTECPGPGLSTIALYHAFPIESALWGHA